MSRDHDLYANLRAMRPGGQRRRRWLKIVLIGMLTLAVGAAGVGAYAWVYVQNKFNETHDPSIEVAPKLPDGPINVLVLGSDDRTVVDPNDRDKRQFRGEESGQRSDTIILIHISADKERATLLHFPRDLKVRIPGIGTGKINGAYNAGPNKVIETITEYSGIPINHYVEVNYASFRQIVNSVGGVEICVNRTYDDPQSGLKVDKPGCYDFQGDQALSFVRARKVDPDGDFGRIRRQQYFMRQLMTKVTSLGFLIDVPRVMKLASAVSEGVVTDADLSLGLVRGIANKLAGFQQNSLDFRVVPSYPAYEGGVSYVLDRPDEAQALFKAIADDAEKLPPFGKTSLSIPEPADVSVEVLNGTTVGGLAGVHADRLKELGYKIRSIDNADRDSYTRTVIQFSPDTELKAKLLREEFPKAKLVEVVEEKLDADVVLILGSDSIPPSPSPSPTS